MCAEKHQKVCGAQAFESYYSALFSDRWTALQAALLAPARRIAWHESLLQPYFLDAGSIAAALSLPFTEIPDNARLLDMCAAPGGKTLVLSRMLHADATLQITANERSPERRNRLVRVLDDHVPPDVRSRITVTNRDAARWCRFEPNSYDYILLDAPCSSERHVITSPAYLKDWTPSRVKTLATAQWALLSSAFLTLKDGGYMVYSTCALSPAENDDVIQKLLKKYDTAEILPAPNVPSEYAQDLAVAPEITRFGQCVMPDTSDGAGPLYYCVIAKRSANVQNQ